MFLCSVDSVTDASWYGTSALFLLSMQTATRSKAKAARRPGSQAFYENLPEEGGGGAEPDPGLGIDLSQLEHLTHLVVHRRWVSEGLERV